MYCVFGNSNKVHYLEKKSQKNLPVLSRTPIHSYNLEEEKLKPKNCIQVDKRFCFILFSSYYL